MRRALVAALAGLAAVAAVAASCREEAGKPAAGERPTDAARRVYTLRWGATENELPWNRTVYVNVTEPGTPWEFQTVVFFPGTVESTIGGKPGCRWTASTELAPNHAMERMLWMVKAEGTFGDAGEVVLPVGRRPEVVVSGDEGSVPGPDWLTFTDEDGGGRLVAMRDANRGVRVALWDVKDAAARDDWRSWDHTAPMRPWAFGEVRAGRFAVAARCAGRQWVAFRTDLVDGEQIPVDVTKQPPGGATVLCENPKAELLLGDDVPVPPLRLTQDHVRSRWEGVPPGRHSMRYPDGTRRTFEARDGAEVRLPR